MSAIGKRGDRGVSAIELALLMPVILATVLLIVQVTLWFHGRQVAEAAAREGARVARAAPADSGGWEQEAQAKARDVLTAIGPQLLDGASVDTAEKDPDERHVTVTGSAVQVIPLLPELAFTITATAGGPIECFRPDDGGEDCE
ncbi:pilus assembly protein [Nonomuraea glycinis]|uniref:TadE family protein n=1 Tax=Nonomuraea glycinis TaxID=2047744 RepID=UPI001CD9B7DD|nr:TadE/TadG family type IV pilus assembly protein [Nonomuraea glycinis]MCA2182943.1 pilus assembly protein [Nonomuraea glycinis]WSG71665.1 pilus assembly protein [Nonomuraea glycinis]